MVSITPTVSTPACFVPLNSIAFGDLGTPAIPVSAANPLPVTDRAYQLATALPLDTVAPTGIALLCRCTQAGTINVQMAAGGTISIDLPVGTTLLPFQVARVTATAATTVSLWVLA